MPNTCLSCFLWKLSMFFSSLFDIPQVPASYSKYTLYKGLIKFDSGSQISQLFLSPNAVVAVHSCAHKFFLFLMSSLSPNF